MTKNQSADRFHKTANKPVHEQIHEVAVSGAVAYRVFVRVGTTLTSFPQRAVLNIDSFELEDFQYPVTVPEGTHQIVFLDAKGKALKTAQPLMITIPPLGEEDATSEAVDSEITPRKVSAARKAPADRNYIRQRQQLELRRRRLEIAAESRHHGAQWEAYELMDATQRDAIERLRYFSAASKKMFEEQISIAKMMRAEIESIPKPPPPEPPPTDWGAVAKEGVDALTSIVKTLLVERRPKPVSPRENGAGPAAAADGKPHTTAPPVPPKRVEPEQAERDRREGEKAERDSLARESAERERLAREHAERERERERVAQEHAEKERRAREQDERLRLELESIVAERKRLEQRIAELEAQRPARTEAPAATATVSAPSPKAEDRCASSTPAQERPTSPQESATTADAVPPATSSVKTAPTAAPVPNPFAVSWRRIKRFLAGMTEFEVLLALRHPPMLMLFLAILRGMTPFGAARAGPGGLLPQAAAC